MTMQVQERSHVFTLTDVFGGLVRGRVIVSVDADGVSDRVLLYELDGVPQPLPPLMVMTGGFDEKTGTFGGYPVEILSDDAEYMIALFQSIERLNLLIERDIVAENGENTVERHLAGQHNQKTHAGLNSDTTQGILNRLRATGGFTVTVHGASTGKHATTGYAVSTRPDRTVRVSAGSTEGQKVAFLQTFVHENSAALSLPGAVFGGWTDIDGTLFLDIVRIEQKRSTAVALGKAHNQIKIFDIKRGKEIDTGGTGRSHYVTVR